MDSPVNGDSQEPGEAPSNRWISSLPKRGPAKPVKYAG